MRCEVRSGRREGVWAGGGASGAQGGATGGWAQGMGGTVKDERSPSLSSLTQQARRAGNTKGECQPLTLVATSESRSVRMATRGDADERGASVQLAKFAHYASVGAFLPLMLDTVRACKEKGKSEAVS